MTKESESTDRDWIEALDGKPQPTADPAINLLALSLRKAFKERSIRQEMNVPQVDSAFYEKTMNLLQREGLLEIKKVQALERKIKRNWLDRLFNENWILVNPSKRFLQLAVAASIVVTVGLVMRTHLYQESSLNVSEIMQVRGSSNVQRVLATDPEERLRQLSTELDNLGIKYQIERKVDSILLKIYGVDLTKEDVVDFMEKNHIKYPMNDTVELDIRSMPMP